MESLKMVKGHIQLLWEAIVAFLSEEVDSWPKLPNLEVSGEKHM